MFTLGKIILSLIATAALAIGVERVRNQHHQEKNKMENVRTTSSKTLDALKQAVEKLDSQIKKSGVGELVKELKEIQWIVTSIDKGYEGAGVIPYIGTGVNKRFVLGINKKGEAEYPGGKVENEDSDMISTARREFFEETGIDIERARFHTKCEITGGNTGFASHIFLVQITESEFEAMNLPVCGECNRTDGTFTGGFIQVDEIVSPEGEDAKLANVVDIKTKTVYPIRKFNREYVLPQIREFLLKHSY